MCVICVMCAMRVMRVMYVMYVMYVMCVICVMHQQKIQGTSTTKFVDGSKLCSLKGPIYQHTKTP